jgi:4-phosphopantoate---beta-alanine ligase
MPEEIPITHPRYESLMLRERIVRGVSSKITSAHGLVAHGRGEAFDYLLGERTAPFAEIAIEAAAATLLLAKHPVLSVNGNAAALVPGEIVELAEVLGCPLQVNIFHPSRERERLIRDTLLQHGTPEILLPEDDCFIPGLDSNRRRCNPNGITAADVVLVPLEDGDRTEALVAMGKRVIVIDLNPSCRSSRRATITIVDNLIRAVPKIKSNIFRLKKMKIEEIASIASSFSQTSNLAFARKTIAETFGGLDDTLS